jgi:uncharacterized repeat protein (TIGR01451 family)
MQGRADFDSRSAERRIRPSTRSPRWRAASLAGLFTLVLALAALNAASALATPRVSNTYSCHEVTWSFTGFPEGQQVMTTEQVKVDGHVIYKGPFDFIGPTAANGVQINVPPGHHEISSHAGYKFGSYKGEGDHHPEQGVTCAAEPAFSIEKLQRIAGEATYTTAELTGKTGQSVEYEIVVTNTGNVPLTFSDFVDEQCAPVSGGPSSPVAPGKSTTYTCKRLLSEAGRYTNAATDTGSPPEGEGSPSTQTSNTVVVTVDPEASFAIEKEQEIAGSGKGYTTEVLKGAVGATVNYQITVKNTGNVPLSFSGFLDERCDAGTISGGPGEATVAPGGSTVYTCTHLVTEADKNAGMIENSATDTGNPPEGDGSPITHTSNVVTVVLPSPRVAFEPSCKAVTFTFRGFPNLPGNVVKEKIKANGKVIYLGMFTFNGPTAENTVSINLPPGVYLLKIHVPYKTNGLNGESDRNVDITCSGEPAFTMQKQQKIDGGSEPFTTSPLVAHVGQQVDYQIVVANTGNVPLQFSDFTDEQCDEGTLSGGPGEAQLAPKETTTYRCDHVLTATDLLAGTFTNTASDTATPPEGDGPPITETSNTVVAEVQE